MQLFGHNARYRVLKAEEPNLMHEAVDRCRLAALLLCLLTAFASAEAPDQSAARSDFAERISELGQHWLHNGQLEPEAFRQEAALLRAAMREDPRNSRYPRLLANALEQIGDIDGQIDAWSAYRVLAPEDRVAQVRLISLYASKMQTNDAKLEYLKDLLGKPSLPAEVRAAIASMCVPLLQERSSDEAIQMAEQGLKLYPLPDLMTSKFFLVWKQGSAPQRLEGLLSLLKTNPVQPQVVQAVARELGAAGMCEEAVDWFAAAISLNNLLGTRTDAQFFTDYASELYLSHQTQAASQLLGNLLDVDRENASYLFLNLSIQRGDGDALDFSQSLALTRDTLIRRWVRLNDLILAHDQNANPAPPDATQLTSPDPGPAIQKAKASNNERLTQLIASTMADLAWLEIYYANQPKAADSYLEALRQLLPADQLVLLRLEGWSALQSGEGDKAKAILAKAADQDALSQLGLIRLEASPQKATRQSLRQLLLRSPLGLDAVTIEENLRQLDASPTTAPSTQSTAAATSAPATQAATQPIGDPAGVESMRAVLTQFPKPWLMLINQPARFYTIKVEPLQTTIHFGEALYARVTLQNRSDYDLVIGFHGPVQPHLWFDAKVSGITQQSFDATAYDQITGVFVLKGHGATSQVVRIDQGALGEALRQRANGSMVIAPTVITNPTRFGNGVGPGAAGQVVPFVRNFIRTPTDLQSASAQQTIRDNLKHGSASEKMAGLDLLNAYVSGLDHQTLQSMRELADAYLQEIVAASNDATPEVSAWASYLAAVLPANADAQQTIGRMIKDGRWQTRLLGLSALHAESSEAQKTWASKLENDPDELVRAFAAATVAFANRPPASTQPVTQPTTRP